MSKQFNKFLLKVLLLSAFIVLIFNIWDNLINANSIPSNEYIETTNNSTFKKINNSSIWKTWVAITTNIWIRFKQRLETPATIYKEVFSISEIISNPHTANIELIWNNMTIIEEYRNVLKTDVKQLLDSSYDRPVILNAYIGQLEYRYVIWIDNIKKLTQQRTVFLNNMASVNAKIETLKIKIEKDFRDNDSEESLNNVDLYLALKKEFYYSRTYIIYINHFLSEYWFLSKYNKLLLDTLINNKDALIKNAFVVIPDSGTQLLRSFNLLYTEEDYKK